MRKTIALILSVGLIFGGVVGVADAKKKKKKKPVPVELKYMMRRDACGAAEGDNTRLSLLDGPDQGCWTVDSGIAYEAIDQAAENGAPFDPSVLWEPYPVVDGLPLVFDVVKPITGEITFYGGDCIADPACSPAGIAAGQATIRVRGVATIAGEDVDLGVYEETFTAVPGTPYTVKVELPIPAELAGATVEGFRVEIFKGGAAIGPGGIEYEDPASFITIPALVKK